jgi:2-phosphoglycerate kinase
METLKVLLIGGSSGVGKTVAAARLATRLGMTWGALDDFRLVLERVTTPQQQPALHGFIQAYHQKHLPPEELAQRYRGVGQFVSEAIEIVIANHVATAIPILLEGDTLIPAVAAKTQFAGLEVGRQVRAVYLVEDDEQVLLTNVTTRGRGVQAATQEQLKRHTRFSWLYGQWLQQEALHYGLAVVAARPYETVVERMLYAIAAQPIAE